MNRKQTLAILLWLFVSQLPAASPRLWVELDGLQSRPGMLKLAVYQGEANWMSPSQAVLTQAVRLAGGKSQTVQLSLLPGEYAISVVHDENNNNRMDMKWLPYPRPGEGVGVSNNVERMGPPRYDEARFDFTEDGQQISIQMRYYD